MCVWRKENERLKVGWRAREASVADIFRWHFDAISPDVSTKSISYFYESHFTGLYPFPIIQREGAHTHNGCGMYIPITSMRTNKKNCNNRTQTYTSWKREPARWSDRMDSGTVGTYTYFMLDTSCCFNNKQPNRYRACNSQASECGRACGNVETPNLDTRTVCSDGLFFVVRSCFGIKY